MKALDHDILDDYLDQPVTVRLAPATSAAAGEEGILRDYSPLGLLLEREDRTRVFIPLATVLTVEIPPKPSWWERLAGVR